MTRKGRDKPETRQIWHLYKGEQNTIHHPLAAISGLSIEGVWWGKMGGLAEMKGVQYYHACTLWMQSWLACGHVSKSPAWGMIILTFLLTHNSLMTTLQITNKYRFQADLKWLHLPVTITLPIMPDSLPSEEPLGTSHSMISPDNDLDSHVINSGMTIQQPQDVVTNTSGMNTQPLEANSRVEDTDLLTHLSVSISLHCAFTILWRSVVGLGH